MNQCFAFQFNGCYLLTQCPLGAHGIVRNVDALCNVSKVRIVKCFTFRNVYVFKVSRKKMNFVNFSVCRSSMIVYYDLFMLIYFLEVEQMQCNA